MLENDIEENYWLIFQQYYQLQQPLITFAHCVKVIFALVLNISETFHINLAISQLRLKHLAATLFKQIADSQN